ncbi:MAG: hypothetical protein QOD99_523, partial [Chthoniobacter sp.]|nr:hypothetical protein [Chthoniobacter sp.]
MFKASLRSAAVALGALFLCTAQAAAFVVNQAGDQSDADINDGRADVDLVTAGDQTTLRAAIQEANKQTGVDTITFTGVITSLTVNGLPALTEPVVIQSPNPDAPVEIRILSGSTLQILDVTTGDTILTGLALPGGLRLRTSGSNQVTKCFVGTDGTGEVAANGNGLTINSAANIISNCLISGNNLDGVSISGSSATLNKIESSRIGTNKGGAAALQNKGDGVLIDNAPGTRITDCVISGNKTSGIHIKNAGATGTVIEKSRIGADNGGTAAIPNAGYGIFMENATDATIEDCIISGNGNGIGISHNNQATNVVIDSNLIGVAKGGTIALANTEGSGIYFDRSGSNIIHGNTISGNKGGGIIMSGSSGNNVVQGNFIGTDSAGTQAIGNGADGVYIDGGPGNTIGDPTGAEGNVISGNALNGITCNAGADTAIIGNMIGTDATGAKPLGNKFIGVNISRSDHAIIKKNVISGNGAGIYFAAFSGTSAGATAEGNFIGTGDGGSPAIPNDGTGVLFLGASNCTLGGTTPGAGNVIAFNKLDGVSVFDQDSVNDAILGNSIHENGGFGIDLAFDFEAEHHGGPKPMPNDPGDTDTGANNLQNYPVLVKEDGVPHGSLNSTPNTLFRIEFFANAKPGKLKHGEGETFIGFANVTTDPDGNVDFNVPGAEKGNVITATATEIISDVPRSTSEFSKVIKAVGGGGIFVVNSIGDDG